MQSKEADTLFQLLSYSRCYWRKSLSRQTATEAKAVHASVLGKELYHQHVACMFISHACRQQSCCRVS